MVLATIPLINRTPKAELIQLLLAIFGLLAGVVASASVFLNDAYFWRQSPHYITPYLFLGAFLLGLPGKPWGLMACIFLLPLSAGLGAQLNAYLGTQFLQLPNSGLDLVAGFFLGSLIRFLPDIATRFKGNDKRRQYAVLMRQLIPWPVALVIVMITLSTAIAISRNVYQSAAATSFKGLLFNLVHFRPIGWHDDYMPIADWIAYALALAMIAVVVAYLKEKSNKNQIIFRPLIAGLIVAAGMGIVQSITGVGLPEGLLVFRKDFLGYAAIGFQPDLHAYAGHLLLGAVGLWGYFSITHSKLERQFILFAVTLSWIGLVLSKSRALFLLAFIAMFIWLIFYLWKRKRRFLIPFALASIAIFSALLIVLLNYANSLNGIPVLSWLGELAIALESRDLTSWSSVSGLFGARFEIWEGAIRMWSQFPLMGIGQGNFYRLSDIASFSRSNFLILNQGENAHNYFLQTWTETGIIGITVFSLALIAPFIVVKSGKVLVSTVIAVISLYLGNIFSHSFLVRENLYLCAVLFGLLYCQWPLFQIKWTSQKKVKNKEGHYRIKGLICLAIIVICFLEIYKSYGATPFTYGFYCYQKEPLYSDNWTNGTFEIPIANGSKGVNLVLQLPKGSDNKQPTDLRLELKHIKRNQDGYIDTIDSVVQRVILNQPTEINVHIAFPDGRPTNKLDDILLRGELSRCYKPRNLGDSIDPRTLGIRIKSMYSYF